MFSGLCGLDTRSLTASASTGSFDNLTGTSSNDVFSAGPGFLETGDSVDGGGGTDTLNARLNSAQTTAPTVSNVENIFVRSDMAADSTFSLADVSGAAQVLADRVTDTTGTNSVGLIVSGAGLTTAVTVGVKGGTAVALDRADATFAFAGVTGTADTATLALDGAAIFDVNIAGIETLNVATTSAAANRIDGTLNAGNASSIVFTGAANTTVDATNFVNAGYAVDASAFTGNLNITLEDQGTGNTSFTGGAGDDVVSLTNGLDVNDTIDGGAGRNTINVTVAADLTAITGAKLSGFQVFDAAGAAVGTYDMDFIDGGASASTIDAVSVSADVGGATVISNLADGAGVTIGATTTAALTVNQKGAAVAGSNNDVLSYELTGAADITVSSLVAANVETVNITSTATVGSTTGHTITATTFADAETVTFSGDEQLTVGTLGAVAATNINASAMTDNFIMGNASDAATILFLQGGSANDTLEIGENTQLTGSVVQGNAGGDLITISTNTVNIDTVVKIAAQGDSTASSYDEIVGFENADVTDGAVTSADTIDISVFGFTGAQATVVDATAKVTMAGNQNAGTESFAISVADSAGFFDDSGVDRGVAFADSGTDTWLFVDADKNGDWDVATDSVMLVGAVSDAFAVADFSFA